MDRFTRKFAQIVPSIRDMDREVLEKQKLCGQRKVIEIGGRSVETFWHRSAYTDAPLLLELHGGGMVLGYAAADDALRQTAADITGATVVGVDYCTAPEYPYPMAIEEIAALIDEIDLHPDHYGIRPRKLAIMGFSGGANLAVAVALRRNAYEGRHVDALLLHYPIVDLATEPADKPPQDDALPDEVCKAFNELYCGESDPRDPYISPLFADESMLKLLPPSVIVAAEHDGLAAEGKVFADKLKVLGTDTRFSCTSEVSHGYIEDYYNPGIYAVRGGKPEGQRYETFMKHAQQAYEASLKELKVLLGE